MTELELYKFIEENSIEWHWDINGSGKTDVLICIDFCDLDEFTTLIADALIEEPIVVHLRTNYVFVWMQDLCDIFDIEIENVFKKEA
jgi:hypothetical protein